MDTSLDMYMPPKNKVQLQALLDFLNSDTIGKQEYMWTCPISNAYVGIVLERSVRELGEYYRMPHPVFLSPVYHNVPFSPKVRMRLSQGAIDSFRRDWQKNLSIL